jgi:hypothetical protein
VVAVVVEVKEVSYFFFETAQSTAMGLLPILVPLIL